MGAIVLRIYGNKEGDPRVKGRGTRDDRPEYVQDWDEGRINTELPLRPSESRRGNERTS